VKPQNRDDDNNNQPPLHGLNAQQRELIDNEANIVNRDLPPEKSEGNLT
jgi:hypothetical protein